MGILGVVTFLIGFGAMASEPELHSFCKELDSALNKLTRPKITTLCPEPVNVVYPSAKATTYEGKPTTSLSEEDLQKLFSEMKSQKEIPFLFTVAGCDEKSHEMSRLMLLKGIKPLKGSLSVEDPRSDLIKVAHPSQADKYIQFHYHVAPVVLVRKNGQEIPYTIDPTYETKAVPTSEWRARMTKLSPKAKVKYQIIPANSYGIGGKVIDFDDQELNRSNQEALKEFLNYSQRPGGEDEYLNYRQLLEWKMNPDH